MSTTNKHEPQSAACANGTPGCTSQSSAGISEGSKPQSAACASEGAKPQSAACASEGTEPRSAAYTREYLDLLEASGTDEQSRRTAWHIAKMSDSYWQGHPSYIGFLPRFYAPEQRKRFAGIVKTTYSILTKVMAHFKEDATYRAEFTFDPRVVELMLLPQRFCEPLPFARIDFFYNEESDTVRFCEFNADASSGMEESRVALQALAGCSAFEAFSARHTLEDDFDELFEGWVRTFLEIYRQTKGDAQVPVKSAENEQETAAENEQASINSSCRVTSNVPQTQDGVHLAENEHLAIAVCFDSAEPEFGELEIYRKLFEAAGMPASIFDVRELAYKGGRLVGKKALAGKSNVEITCVWRYCIMVDLLEHWADVQGFLDALRNDAVVMIGSFATHLVHDKQLFCVLHRLATSAFLTEAEQKFVRESIPFTAFLDDANLDLNTIKREPNKWIIKPTDWYSSINVFAGLAYEQSEWERIVDECAAVAKSSHAQGNVHNETTGSPYLVQEFCEPYRTPAIPLYGREEDFTARPRSYGNLLGLYVFAGRFAGMFSRLGPGPVITEAQGGSTAPTLWVVDE